MPSFLLMLPFLALSVLLVFVLLLILLRGDLPGRRIGATHGGRRIYRYGNLGADDQEAVVGRVPVGSEVTARSRVRVEVVVVAAVEPRGIPAGVRAVHLDWWSAGAVPIAHHVVFIDAVPGAAGVRC